MKNKLPCINCILLSVCTNKKFLYCELLLSFLTMCQKKLKYPKWPNMLHLVRKTLGGNWCAVGIDHEIICVQKDRKITDEFR